MKNYTFTFSRDTEARFNRVLASIDCADYTIVQAIAPLAITGDRDEASAPLTTVIRTESEVVLAFRMAMPQLTIRRERTEEELAEEQALYEANKITINVYSGDAPLP